MNAPDYISPIVGYRVWQWDAAGLNSLNGEPWAPGKPLAAGCRYASSGLAGCAEAMHDAHDAPQANCTCGVYAAKNLAHLRTFGYTQYGIHGEVKLWGKVIEHDLGWHAQFGYPKKLVLPLLTVPFSMGTVESRLKTLAAYGCDVFLSGKERDVPLWAKRSGYDAAGLGLLIQRCKNWYARREQEHQIKPGDRVAVLGRGIAVVERADGQVAEVVLWSRATLRIPRKDIVWDRQNMRWEADAMDVRETGNRVPSDRDSRAHDGGGTSG